MTLKTKINYFLLASIFIFFGCSKKTKQVQKSGNPAFEGWYADPEGTVFGDEFWIFPTYSDNQYYMFYGDWGKCNLVKLNDDFTGFIPWEDGTIFKDVTPENYVEGPVLFQRNGKYYFMWSEGGWTNGTYKVAYGISDKITGPFQRIGTILESDENVATGAGHNSVINIPGTDRWLIVYHRRPIPNEDRDHRVNCVDNLEFNDDGTIKPVIMTFEGVSLEQ